MGHILGIPNELLLRIASYLPSQKDYYNLSLVCRQLRPIGEDLLYRAPNVHQQGRNRNWQLARTILTKPHLAQLVQSLKTSITPNTLDGLPAKYLRQLPEIKSLVQTSLKDSGFDQHTRLMISVETNFEAAVVGALLVAMPNLTDLRVSVMHYLDLEMEASMAEFEYFFQHIDESPVPFLEKLESFSTVGLVEWRTLLSFGNLKTLTLRLQHYYLNHYVLPMEDIAQQAMPSITTVNLIVELTILLPSEEDALEYVQQLITLCPKVSKVSVGLVSCAYAEDEQQFQQLVGWQNSWELLLEALAPARHTLQALFLDISRFSARHRRTREYMYELRELRSLSQFSNLRHFHAPFNALFSRENSALPYAESIQNIELTVIPGLEHLFNRHAERLVEARRLGRMNNLEWIETVGRFGPVSAASTVKNRAWKQLQISGIELRGFDNLLQHNSMNAKV